MKKILFILQSLSSGGAERVISVLTETLSSKEQYEISVLTLFNSGDFYSLSDKVKLSRLNGESDSKLKTILRIREFVKNYKPDTLISFQCHVNVKVLLAVLGKQRYKKIVSERNDPAVWKDRKLLDWLRNRLYKTCDCVVFQTEDARDYFPYEIRRNSVVIPNPIKEDLPEPWIGERKKTIVNFCRLAPQKNLKLLIDSFELFMRSFPEYVLEIYGDGPDRNTIDEYVIEKGLQNKVYIYPAVSDIHRRIIDAGMFVSSSDYEGLSNSMLEAMAIGVPVICTDCPCGGAKMVIENNVNGILVPVNDKDKMAQAMMKIAGDDGFARKLGVAASSIRMKLHRDNIAQEWEKII